MTPELQVAIVAAIAGPLLGLIGIIVSARNSKRAAEKSSQAALQAAQASVENAKAAAKNATSQEFQILSESFRGALERQDRELGELRQGRREDQKLIREMDEDLEVLERQNEILIDHLGLLEDLVPNPPGAPPRPKLPDKATRRRRGVE